MINVSQSGIPLMINGCGLLENSYHFPVNIEFKCNLGLCENIKGIQSISKPLVNGGILNVALFHANLSQTSIEKLFKRQYASCLKGEYHKFCLEITYRGHLDLILSQWLLQGCSIGCLESSDTYGPGNHFQYFYTEIKIEYDAAQHMFALDSKYDVSPVR